MPLPPGRTPINTKTLEILSELIHVVMKHDPQKAEELASLQAQIIRELKSEEQFDKALSKAYNSSEPPF